MIVSHFYPSPHKSLRRCGDRLCFHPVIPRERTNGVVLHWDYLGFVWGDRRWQIYWRRRFRPRGNFIEYRPTGNRNLCVLERGR